MLREWFFENTWALVFSFIVWVPLGFWIAGLFQWAVVGDIEPIFALFGIIVALLLGCATMITKDPIIPPLIFAAVVATMIAFPMVRRALENREHAEVDVMAVQKAYEGLMLRPGDAFHKFKLAKALHRRGMIGPAIALADEAIKQMPRQLFEEEHRLLKQWQRVPLKPDQLKPVACLDCGTLNDLSRTHCERCGSPFHLERTKGAWVDTTLARKFVAGWGGLILAIIGIPFAARALPPAAALVVILGIMLLAVLVLVFAFKPRGGQASA